MKLFYEYLVIFFNLSPTSSHVHSLQVENCDSNSRLVVAEDDDSKFRLERVNPFSAGIDFELSQQAQDVDPVLNQCWANVVEDGPTFHQHEAIMYFVDP